MVDSKGMGQGRVRRNRVRAWLPPTSVAHGSGNHHVLVFIVWLITYISGHAGVHLCGLVIIPRPVPSLVESIVKAQFQDNGTVMQRVDSMKYLVGDAGRYFMLHRRESVFDYILLSLSPLRWCKSFSKCQRTAQTTNTHGNGTTPTPCLDSGTLSFRCFPWLCTLYDFATTRVVVREKRQRYR